jgi:hypothetical protein
MRVNLRLTTRGALSRHRCRGVRLRKQAARKLKRAQILLAADAGASDEEIARNVGVGEARPTSCRSSYRSRGSTAPVPLDG